MKKTLLTLSAAALVFIAGCDPDSKTNEVIIRNY